MRFTTFAIAGCFVVSLFIMNMWPQNGQVRINSADAQEEQKKGTNAPPIQKNQLKQRLPVAKNKIPLPGVSKKRSPSEELAYEVLTTELPTIQFIESPLSEVLSQLSELTDVSIIVNQGYLDDQGLSSDSPVTLNVKNAKLTTILELIFSDQLGVDDWVYGVKDSFIYISGQDNVSELMEVRVYDCSDFAIKAIVRAPIMNSYMGGGFGGQGGQVSGGGGGGFFSVQFSQPQNAETAGGFGGGGGGLSQKPNPIIVEGGKNKVQSTENKKTKDSVDATLGYKTYEIEDLSELINCVQMTIDPDSWADVGGEGTLNQVGSALVVNHTIKNHHQIEELLKMLRQVKTMRQ